MFAGPLTPNNSLTTNCISSQGEVLHSPSSPSQCGLMTAGPGEEVWRGSSIASLRRRAFEHSAVSMSVFR